MPSRRFLTVLRRYCSGVEARRKRSIQPADCGSARGRSSNGASVRPSQRNNCKATPGEFHGSDMLGVITPPFA